MPFDIPSANGMNASKGKNVPGGPGVLLLGHGSHVNAGSSEPVHRLVRRLRDRGRYPEVRSAFWKEEPLLTHAFLLMESREVVAIPIFTSEGYFTDRVLPRELGIDPPVSWVDRVLVRYTRPVGTHPAMARVLVERARECMEEHGLLGAPSDLTLLVLGHGTERHPASGEVTERLTAELAGTSGFARVTCAFLDQAPRLETVLEGLETPRAVVVPFFIAEGWHVGETIPEDLNLDEGRGRGVAGGVEVFFAGPAGTHPAMARVVEELVEEALMEEALADSAAPEGQGASAGKGAWEVEPAPPSLPARARADFLGWIDAGGAEGRRFLQTRVRRLAEPPGASGEARYEIRHVDDREVDSPSLRALDGPDACVEWARWDAEGGYRPLSTAPTLAPGRILTGLTRGEVWEAYAHLYPAAPVHWHLGREGALPAGSFDETAGRQTGIYEIVAGLTDEQVEATRKERCSESGCLRAVRWSLRAGGGSGGGTAGGESGGAETDDEGVVDGDTGGAVVPCPEPCTLFIATARKHAVGDGH